ncbi:MAG: acyl-CoA thioesterase [Mucinivorans sp.]
MVKRKEKNIALRNQTPLRVRFSEVDSMQIVWHGEYVRYFEDGREAFGREFKGLGYMDLYESGYTAPMVDMTLQYKRPLRCNDTAIVETRYIASEGAKICFEYEIRRESDGEIVATGSSVQVFLDRNDVLQLNSPEFYINWREKWGVK